MSAPRIALLPERGILYVQGDDAASFLQGLVTNDMNKLKPGNALFAGLLTPQGKILFDFFIVQTASGYLIDVAADKAGELAKRLRFYKLRAKVDIEDLSEEKIIGAIWQGRVDLEDVIAYDDPRLEAMGQRFISDPQQFDTNGFEADYMAHRIALGIPEGGLDFAFGSGFAHEANMDALHGIDFEKGCYVGQEVVSRMQHRGTTRKRIVPVTADEPLPATGTEIRAGSALIGTMGSAAETQGLALIRLDRAGEALENNEALTAGDTPIKLVQPQWAPFTVPGGLS